MPPVKTIDAMPNGHTRPHDANPTRDYAALEDQVIDFVEPMRRDDFPTLLGDMVLSVCQMFALYMSDVCTV